MMSKKPSVVLSGLQSLRQSSSPSPQCTTSSYLDARARRQTSGHSRSYAQVAEPPRPDEDERASSWPEAIPPARTPSPYQILRCGRGAPYSKTRFYELVKLYHPDRTIRDTRHHPELRDVPRSVCLERYRLIVAAHAVLSDPVRRSAYDRYGAGWASHLAPADFTSDSGPAHGSAATSSSWRPGEDPMQNATWEDWERWYRRDEARSADRDGEHQQTPVYISNLAFLSVILAFAAVGGFGQVTRANSFSTSIISHRDLVHAEASKELMRARQEARANESRQGSIENFLRRRGGGISSDETQRKLLPEPQVCSSEETRSSK